MSASTLSATPLAAYRRVTTNSKNNPQDVLGSGGGHPPLAGRAPPVRAVEVSDYVFGNYKGDFRPSTR